jgi:hypothetical protein
MKKDRRGINPASKPSGDGCVECLASPRGWWLHLRRCAECGHIGCCDSSPSQHASKHAAATGHPIIGSFEPCEDWFFDFEKQRMVNGVELLPNTLTFGGSTRARTVRKSPSQLGIAPALAGVNHFSFDRYERWRTENEQGPHGGFQRWSARQEYGGQRGT